MRARRRPHLLGALALRSLAIACLGLGCAPTPSPPNVLLISIDSLRPDHLHCYGYGPETSPNIDRLAAEGVVFEQVPSSINPRWTEHARAYYSFQLMGILGEIHTAFFDALHLKRQRLDNIDAIAGFVAERGFDEKVFREYYFSFPVETQLRKNAQNEKRYGISGVPAVIVNGKYLVSGSVAGSNERMIQIINFLVAQELAL